MGTILDKIKLEQQEKELIPKWPTETTYDLTLLVLKELREIKEILKNENK